MYPHVRRRFKSAGLPLPYGEDGFTPGKQQIAHVNQMLRDVKSYFSNSRPLDSIRIESCAEPGSTEAIQCGCISSYDLELLGLHDDNADQYGFQRKNCIVLLWENGAAQSKTSMRSPVPILLLEISRVARKPQQRYRRYVR